MDARGLRSGASHRCRRHLRRALGFTAAALATLAFATPAAARTAYVTDRSFGHVAVPIDTVTHTAGPEIEVETDPTLGIGSERWSIAITPDGATAYVGSVLTPPPPFTNQGMVIPIDLATDTPGPRISTGGSPKDIAITPDGATAFVAGDVTNSVIPIDIATNTPEAPITVGDSPTGIAITPDGQTAYVSNREPWCVNFCPPSPGSVSVIDIPTRTVVATVDVGALPNDLAITPDGATAYVVNAWDANVTPIDTATNTAGTPIDVGTSPNGIAITPDGATAYVTNNNDSTVTPIDIATNTPGTPIAVGSSPRDQSRSPPTARPLTWPTPRRRQRDPDRHRVPTRPGQRSRWVLARGTVSPKRSRSPPTSARSPAPLPASRSSGRPATT